MNVTYIIHLTFKLIQNTEKYLCVINAIISVKKLNIHWNDIVNVTLDINYRNTSAHTHALGYTLTHAIYYISRSHIRSIT